ncbi:hypothetical protein M6B38_376025 [Iris pallida]|uniref:Uncharacterized protein n=1 Tax=Iris pallida TaxID=29817 RepID=A0AAX6G9P5_IRIPA|nr:hypothetical protein M6B38_376025 [Iris pallida]
MFISMIFWLILASTNSTLKNWFLDHQRRASECSGDTLLQGSDHLNSCLRFA